MAVANRILMYNTQKGEIVKALKGSNPSARPRGHYLRARLFLGWEKIRVRRVSLVPQSCSADNMVLLWSREGKGITSYKHSRKIQALSFNPLLQTVGGFSNLLQLASCTTDDFGVYNPN